MWVIKANAIGFGYYIGKQRTFRGEKMAQVSQSLESAKKYSSQARAQVACDKLNETGANNCTFFVYEVVDDER